MGPHQRAARSAVCGGFAVVQDLLDRLPKATAMHPEITMFRDWLLAEAARDIRHLQKLKPKNAEPRAA